MKPNDFENDPLWDLLGKSKPAPEVSPFFARNVLRQIRLHREEAEPPSFFQRWRRLRLVFAGTAAVAITGLTFSVLLQDRDGGGFLARHPGDAEVISHLDELLTYEDTTVWLDRSAY